MLDFSIKTDAFDGPLDLLLHLIEKNEVDIFDIPIAPITEQYLMHMRAFKDLDMDALSGFLLMAATLLSIKARMLVPRKEEEQGEPEIDPRAELVSRLLDYKLFRERAEEFAQREKEGILTVYREKDQSFDWGARTSEITGVVSIEKLRSIFEDILARQERRTDKIRGGFGTITLERFTVSDRIAYIARELRLTGRISFYALFDASSTKEEKIVTFLALLELVKQNRAAVVQEGLFEDIVCKAVIK